MGDMVNEPPHYRWLPMNIEAIDITDLFNFNLGNSLKYILRSKHKGREIEILKAQWCIAREIKRIEKGDAVKLTPYQEFIHTAVTPVA